MQTALLQARTASEPSSQVITVTRTRRTTRTTTTTMLMMTMRMVPNFNWTFPEAAVLSTQVYTMTTGRNRIRGPTASADVP